MRTSTSPTYKSIEERMRSIMKIDPQNPVENGTLLALLGTETSSRVIKFILRRANPEFEETLMICTSIATNEFFHHDANTQKVAVSRLARSSRHVLAHIYLECVAKDAPNDAVRTLAEEALRKYLKVDFDVPFGLPRDKALAQYRVWKKR